MDQDSNLEPLPEFPKKKHSFKQLSRQVRKASMFARKPKSTDVQNSLQRFCDIHRDAASRAKHFKYLLEQLCVEEKRQLVDDYSFETFHLVDSLLLQVDLSIDSQSVMEAESALWTLEQVLCLAPELVGKGWQRHAIESILKRALLPQNLIAVRKMGIRLFLLWYQSLAVFNNTTTELDVVFQSLLPYFPLSDGRNTETVLQGYCDHSSIPTNGHVHNGAGPGPSRPTPIIVNGQHNGAPGTREKAQTLQVYLDKFLDYCNRETTKIEWDNEARKLECAKFLLDRVIVLYVYQVFPEMETNGVDVYEGWEGSEEPGEQLDTADPVVIARYWLIRWMTNIASAGLMENAAPGLVLFRKALFSSQKAINTLLTLMREAMQLPLACANVIHKVLFLIRNWLLQKEIPPFVDVENGVPLETCSLLLIHLLTSFFKSPYLSSSGERLQSAVSLTHTILQISRDLANPTNQHLVKPLSKTVWTELIKRITEAVDRCCSRSDAFGCSTAGGFTQTLLSICVFIRAIREMEVDERMWDEIWLVFKHGKWMQMVEQWSKVVDNITRALILNLFGIDINASNQAIEDGSTQASDQPSSRRQLARSDKSSKSSETGSVNGGYPNSEADDEALGDSDSNQDRDMSSVVQATGNGLTWLKVWMRIVGLVDPAEPQNSQQAVQTSSKCIDTLLGVGYAQSLVNWLSERLLRLNIAQQPHGIPALCAVLIKAEPPLLQRAYILYHLVNCLRSDVSPIVLEQVPQMGLEDVALVSKPTIEALQKLVKNAEFSSRAVRVAALLSLDNPDAENILLNILENRAIEIDLPSLILSINALCILILERADAQLFDTLLKLVLRHNQASGILPIMCTNLLAATKLGFQARLVEALQYGMNLVKEKKTLNDMKWQLCSLAIQEKPHKTWKVILDKLAQEQDIFLEGLMMTLSLQYPLPVFPLTQWNSLEPQLSTQDQQKVIENTVFMKHDGAILSFEKPQDSTIRFTARTVVGRHSWTIEEEKDVSRTNPNVTEWLKNLAMEPSFNRHVSARRKSSCMMGTMPDPFQDIPIYNPPASERAATVDSSDMLAFIKKNQRRPFGVQESSDDIRKSNVSTSDFGPFSDTNLHIWRHFAADFQLLKSTQNAPGHFGREIRHLDNTLCREVHKVAVIYVGPGQEDKQSILSNASASEHFNCFVEGLGWPVTIGPNHLGYSGGLPAGQTAPYYANSDTELVFHVSTMLNGDAQMRMKHLGNDEVHIVWSENAKPYKRDVLATRFCDVLIVLYPVSAVLIRVHIETQNPLLQFGPLFDGAYVHTKQIASLIRDTVLNASRAYRIAQQEIDRPNKHRENVFKQTQTHLTDLTPSTAIISLYVPSLKS